MYHSVRRSKPARRKLALFHTFTPTRGVTITYISHTFYVFLKTIYTSSRTGETVVPWSAACIYEEVIRPEGYRLRRHMHLRKRPPRKKWRRSQRHRRLSVSISGADLCASDVCAIEANRHRIHRPYGPDHLNHDSESTDRRHEMCVRQRNE